MNSDNTCHGHECHSCSGENADGKSMIIRLAAGAALFAVALFAGENAPYIFLASYAVLGWRVVYTAVVNLLKGRVFDENFLMSVATGGALAIGEYPEAVAVMLFYLVGEYFQGLAVNRSKRSIEQLMDIRPDYANIRINGELVRVSPETVKVSDLIIIKPGERIPLDGVVEDGESSLDTKALTGEAMPGSVKAGDEVLSGCVNQNGALTVRVTKTFGESTVARIIELVRGASDSKAPTESFITKFSRYYTPAVVGLAALLALLPPLFAGGGWALWLHRALVLLVISCPCALVISVPLGFFGGIGRASKAGVLVKGGNYLEALNDLDVVVFDKTGTLTKGAFEVTDVEPAELRDELLEYAAYAEAMSSHPVARSVMRAYGKSVEIESGYTEFPGEGVSVTAKGRHILAGNGTLMRRKGISFPEDNGAGTRVYVAVDGEYRGKITVADTIKPDAGAAISGLRALGVRRTVMLTGDNAQTAQAVAEGLSLDEVHAQLLPHQKVEALRSLEKNGTLAFVGDGINDAPVLAGADIGIAMGGLGSDAAIEAADVVLMTDEPYKLVEAIRIAGATRRIVWQNIVFALGVKAVFLVLGAFGISGMWEAVFADTGVSILAILNSLRVLRVKL